MERQQEDNVPTLSQTCLINVPPVSQNCPPEIERDKDKDTDTDTDKEREIEPSLSNFKI